MQFPRITSSHPTYAGPLLLAALFVSSCGAASETLVESAAEQAPPPPKTRWPNSDARLVFSAGVFPDQLKWSAPAADAVLAPPVVWAAQSELKAHSKAARPQLVSFLRAKQPDLRLGCYFTAVTVRPQPLFEPAETVPYDLVKDALLATGWDKNEPQRRYIDIRRPDVRQKMAEYFVRTAKEQQAYFLALDNFTFEFWNPPEVPAAEWHDAQYALLQEIYTQAHQVNLLVVANTATNPPQTWPKLLDKADGFVFEMPISRKIRENGQWVELQLQAYRLALDRGLFVGLIPYRDSVGVTAAAAMLVREPGDALFVAPREYQPKSADWMDWPAKWGKALGKYKRDGTRFEREFERAKLVVDFAKDLIEVY